MSPTSIQKKFVYMKNNMENTILIENNRKNTQKVEILEKVILDII